MATVISNVTISSVKSYFKNNTYLDKYLAGDLEYLVMLLRGFLRSFETLSLYSLDVVLSHMHDCLFAHTEVAYSYQYELYSDFYDVMGRILGKLHFDKITHRSELVQGFGVSNFYNQGVSR